MTLPPNSKRAARENLARKSTKDDGRTWHRIRVRGGKGGASARLDRGHGGMRVRFAHIAAVGFLSALSLAFAASILYGEGTDQWYLGGAAVGALLLAYSFIVLVLRKMGLVGPRKAER